MNASELVQCVPNVDPKDGSLFVVSGIPALAQGNIATTTGGDACVTEIQN